MLTDSISQLETTAAAHIPKSLQKLIHNLQKANSKKPFSAPKNPPLNVSMKKQVATGKQKNNNKPPRTSVGLIKPIKLPSQPKNVDLLRKVPEVGDDESVASTSSKPDKIDNQKWIEFMSKIDNEDMEIWTETESLQKTKDNSLLVPSNDFNDASNYSSSVETLIAHDDKESHQLSCSTSDAFTNEKNCGNPTNWRTFNDMVQTNIENFFPEKPKKKIIAKTYGKRNLNPLRRNRVAKPNQDKALLSDNQTVNKEWLNNMKEENEMLRSMVEHVKSVNNDILRARQEISKFYFNRK